MLQELKITPEDISLFKKEYFELSRQIEKHHNLFYFIWKIGVPVLTNSIPTACMKFNQTGQYIEMCFNPEFWNSMDTYNRAFVVCHEILHCYLNHAPRSLAFLDKNPSSQDIVNQAADIAVNHMLVNNFGFDILKIKDADDICWTHTCFPDMIISNELSFEEYLMMFENNPPSGGSVGGSSNNKEKYVFKKILDSHENTQEKVDLVKEICRLISEDNFNELKPEDLSPISKEAPDEIKSKILDYYSTKLSEKRKPQPTKKWKKIIKKWKRRGTDPSDFSQWTIENKRYLEISDEFCFPYEYTSAEDGLNKSKINTLFFMDVSGSCVSYQDTFIEASLTIPQKHFKLKTYVFGESVRQVDLCNDVIYSQMWTNFRILEDRFQVLNKIDPIDLVMVISDGCAEPPKFTQPHKWHWFIINPEMYTTQVDNLKKAGVNVYNLKDFFKGQEVV